MLPENIRDASAVMLVRTTNGRRELFWVRRSREVSFAGGFYAFPGGRYDEPDGDLRVTAIRELFEETGVLLAHPLPSKEKLDEGRKALLGGGRAFADVLLALGAPRLDRDTLLEAGRWLTPPFIRSRFDARFFAVELPANQQAEVWPGELADGEWITPANAIARWEQGIALLHPPALHLIRCLAMNAFPECAEAMQSPANTVDFVADRIEFQAGVLLFPLRTPTLPPATHTNCYLIGEEELVVIDPASRDEDEQARLAALCDSLIAEGRRFREILITHHHHDHVGGVDALRHKLGVPVRAHRVSAELLAGEVQVDSFIEDGEIIALPGRLGLRLRAVFTPGHTPGHICYLEERSGALFAGDMIAGIGTIVVNPPEGDMRDYIDSLLRLRALPVHAIYPAHGPAIPDGPRKIDEYLAHRAERETKIVSALRTVGPATPEELVPHVYTDVASAMYPLAARSLAAVLDKLVKDGAAQVADGERYQLLPKSTSVRLPS
jgi:ribonuclease/clavin/mitogillin